MGEFAENLFGFSGKRLQFGTRRRYARDRQDVLSGVSHTKHKCT
ncbi:hypothetical protein [Azospirillum melinis]